MKMMRTNIAMATNRTRQGRTVLLTHDSGVATVEYVILLMLIAVASIGAWVSLGKAVKAQIECAADALEDDEVHCSGGSKPDNGSPTHPAPADNPSSVSPTGGNTLSNGPSQDSSHSTAVSTGTSNGPAGTAQSPNSPSPGSDTGSVPPASTPPSGTSTVQPGDNPGVAAAPKPKK
jgi:Flp pilus assembly pilin Flp